MRSRNCSTGVNSDCEGLPLGTAFCNTFLCIQSENLQIQSIKTTGTVIPQL